MRLFSDYMKEAVDFRLGGKKKKGMDDGASLDSLEKGDKVWMYQYYSSSVIHELEMEVETIDREKMLIELYSNAKGSRYVGSFIPEKAYDDNTNVVLSYQGPDVILSTKQLSQQDVIRIQNDVRTKRVS